MMKEYWSNFNLRDFTTLCLCMLFVAGIGLMSYFTPTLQEDLEFCASNWRFAEGLTRNVDWSGMWDDIVFHQTYTNGRLGDRMVIPIMCLVPKLIFAILCVGVALLMLNGIMRLVGAGIKQVHVVTLIVLLLLLWFPWHENLFLVSYSINYLWSACMGIWIVYAVMAFSPVECRWYILCLEAALCVVAGMWHELIAFSVGCALVVFTLMGDAKAVRGRLILIGSLFVGLMINLLSGGLQTRVSVTDISFNAANLVEVWHHIPYPVWTLMPVVIYFLMLVVWCCSSRGVLSLSFWQRDRHGLLLKNRMVKLHVVCIIVIMSNVVVFAFFGHPRTFVFGNLFSIVGIASLFLHMWTKCKDWVKKIIGAVICVLSVIMLVNLYVTIAYQVKINETYKTLKQEWLMSEDGVMFYDLPPMFIHKNYPWHMIINDMYIATWKHYYLSNFIRPQDPPKKFIIIPSALKHVKTADRRWLNFDLGIYMAKGHMLYANPDSLDFSVNPANGMSCFGKIHMKTRLVDGSDFMFWCLVFPFKTDDGSTCCHIHPLNEGDVSLVDSVLSVEVFPPMHTWNQPPTNYGR